MKTSTLLILGGIGVAVVYFATRPTTTPLLNLGGSSASKTNNVFGALGGLLGGFVSTVGGAKQTVFSGPSSGSSSNVSPINSGITPQEVRALDSTNVDSYDAQGTADDPVYGVAGLDY